VIYLLAIAGWATWTYLPLWLFVVFCVSAPFEIALVAAVS
jgi:hypothetical protein